MQEEGNADVFVSLTWIIHHKQLQSPELFQTPADGQSSVASPIQSAASKGKFVFAVTFFIQFIEMIFPDVNQRANHCLAGEPQSCQNKGATERLLGSKPD